MILIWKLIFNFLQEFLLQKVINKKIFKIIT